MPRALLSVSDKSNLVDFANVLVELGWELVASGGTARLLKQANLPISPVEQLTHHPEMLGGRVKTLHPAVHAGILMRDRQDDIDEVMAQGYAPINMIVCNLYPFQKAVADPNISLQDAIEQIDIGGVTLLRAAAKNFFRVTILCDPQDYSRIVSALRGQGEIGISIRRELAVKAFRHTRDYDRAIHAYLADEASRAIEQNTLSRELAINLSSNSTNLDDKDSDCVYYNYRHESDLFQNISESQAKLTQQQLISLDTAWRIISQYDEPCIVFSQDRLPLGVLWDLSPESLNQMVSQLSDLLTGSTFASNQTIDWSIANALGVSMLDMILAPSFESDAHKLLSRTRRSCQLIAYSLKSRRNEFQLQSVLQGVLVEKPAVTKDIPARLKTVTNRLPTSHELDAMRLGWLLIQHVQTHAVIITDTNRTYSIRGGLPFQEEVLSIALRYIDDDILNKIIVFDTAIKSTDIFSMLSDKGITAILQPGGGLLDSKIIQQANETNIAMVFTNISNPRY